MITRFGARLGPLGRVRRLDRAYGNVFPILRFIDVVKMRAAVQQVAFALVPPLSLRFKRMKQRHQQGGAVGHRGIHDLAFAGPAGLPYGTDEAKRQEQGAPSEISDQVQRRHGLFAGATDRVQRTGQRYVVDVVPRGL